VRSVDDHLEACLSTVEPLPSLELALVEAVDCLLDEDVVAGIDLPPFDTSAVDGYAVMLPDVTQAEDLAPAQLSVIADLPAGHVDQLRLSPGTSARIMAGAGVPVGCGAVVPLDWTDAGLASVRITRSAPDDLNVRRAREDLCCGDVVLRSGTRLTPRHVLLLAALGRERVTVRPRPRVVVISTGNELAASGRALRAGQVHDALTAAAAELGCLALHVGVLPDDPRQLLDMLEDQLMRADLVVTSGGAGTGAHDSVRESLSRLGTVHFGTVSMEPGGSQGIGVVGPDATPVVCLPGDPVGAMVSFEVFVRPVLRTMWGEADVHREQVTASLFGERTSPRGRREFVPGTLTCDDDGRRQVHPLGTGRAHRVTDLARADCLAIVGEEVHEVRSGASLRCMPLERARR
jgi:molybdopterin molybdotransferase